MIADVGSRRAPPATALQGARYDADQGPDVGARALVAGQRAHVISSAMKGAAMRRLASGCGVTMLAIAVSACEGVGSVGLVTTGPSAPAAITASINYVSVSQAPAFGVSACTGSRAAA